MNSSRLSMSRAISTAVARFSISSGEAASFDSVEGGEFSKGARMVLLILPAMIGLMTGALGYFGIKLTVGNH